MTLPFSVDLLRTKVKQTKGKETNTHLSELSQQMKEALISRQQELSTMVVNWEREWKKLGCTNTSRDYPKLIQDAVHKQNLVRKVLTHEWKIDFDTL